MISITFLFLYSLALVPLTVILGGNPIMILSGLRCETFTFKQEGYCFYILITVLVTLFYSICLYYLMRLCMTFLMCLYRVVQAFISFLSWLKFHWLLRRHKILHLKQLYITLKPDFHNLRKHFIEHLSRTRRPLTSSNKPHALAAAFRSETVRKMIEAVELLCKRPFFYQHSKMSYGVYDGNLDPLVTKDTFARPLKMSPTEHSVIILVDDDYYCDLPKRLAKYPNNIWLLYTVSPKHAGYTGVDYSYSFDSSGRLHMRAEGGSAFKHYLWDFSSDHCTVGDGADESYINTFLIEKVSMPDDHDVVMFFPMSRVNKRLLEYDLFHPKPLKRLAPVIETTSAEHIVLVVGAGLETYVSISEPLLETSCDIPRKVFDQLAAITNCTTTTITKHSLEGAGIPQETSGLAMSYFRSQKNVLRFEAISKFVPTSTVYSYGTPDVWKPTCKVFMTPLVGGRCFIPNSDIYNEWAAINTRLLQFDNKVVIKPYVLTVFNEFLELLSLDVGAKQNTLVPFSTEDVMSRTRTKAQHTKMAMADLCNRAGAATGFVKAEAYPSLKDPRGIINYSSEAKHKMAPFSYALAEVLKKASWYSFVEPEELERKLSSMVTRARETFSSRGVEVRAVEIDAKRFDGHVNELQRSIALMLYIYFFMSQYFHTIYEDYKQDYFCLVHLQEFCFNLIWKRGSGSMVTSIENSFLSAFFQYLSNRIMVNDQQMTPEEAYNNIGLIGGDDVIRCVGYSKEEFAKRMARVGKLVGHEFELTETKFPTFLGRAYGGLLFGDFSSCLVPDRVFVKLHVSADRNADPRQKLAEKAVAILITDQYTPVVSDWARAVQNCSDYRDFDLSKLKYSSDLSQALYLYTQQACRYNFQPDGLKDWMEELWYGWLFNVGFDMERFISDCQRPCTLLERASFGPYCGEEVEDFVEGNLILPGPPERVKPLALQGSIVKSTRNGRNVIRWHPTTRK